MKIFEIECRTFEEKHASKYSTFENVNLTNGKYFQTLSLISLKKNYDTLFGKMCTWMKS